MAKTVTRQRLITALDLIDNLRERRTGAKMQIVQMLTCRGLHAMFDQAFGAEVDRTTEDQRILLESLYSDVKIRREFVEEALGSCRHFGQWVEYVFRIQRKHQISGLLLCADGMWRICDRLRLIESDLPWLAAQSATVVDRFLAEAAVAGITRFWLRSDDDWVELTAPEVVATSKLYQWAEPDREDLLLVTGLDFESSNSRTAWIVASKSQPEW
jgi:hypothetical protein